MRIFSLTSDQLTPILERKRNPLNIRNIPKIPLDILLINILEKANAFVPSSSGSILLDDPLQKMNRPESRELIFVSCFGEGAEALIGERIPIGTGIVGAVYQTGTSKITNDAYQAPEFNDQYDRKLGFVSQTILCVPIRIEQAVCGVIELLNKRGGGNYLDSERELLEIFAQYISLTIQNAVDAKKIEKMVRIDDLTGLANDRCLHERLPLEVEQCLESGMPLSALFMDLDRFKSINDTHGHMAGSNTLAEFGHLLEEIVDIPGATLSRYGGDEFVILMPDTDREGALRVAESIRSRTQRHVFLDSVWGHDEEPLHLGGIITTSIGVSTLDPRALANPRPKLTDLVVRLLQTADKAMYVAKENGKNRVIFHPM
jgi:diguanylate cyclase (GGDEF)-like protein